MNVNVPNCHYPEINKINGIFLENGKGLDQEKKKRTKEFEKKEITREEEIENDKFDYEAKRLEFRERTRAEHVALAIELEKELNFENKTKKDLRIGIFKGIKINEKTNDAILKIKQVFFAFLLV